MFNKTLTVEELNGYIHSIFTAEEMLIGVSVFGEVSGFKISGAHAYFTIKGKDAAIPCNLFNYRRTYAPKDGESVIVKGSPDYYVKTGKLSFNVTSVQPVGIGDLHAELEKLKASLLKEGIFAAEHKKAIPAYPHDICVVTAKTGAVIRDIYRTIRNVNRTINIHLFNVRVQGQGAEKEIAQAIAAVDGMYDVIIVARGGGSFEDLAPFNTEIIARAVYNAQTPVISAVGHETDFTICDLAADARAATPTAAAHIVAFDEREIKANIFDLMGKMGLSLQERVKREEEQLVSVTKSIGGSATLILEKTIAKCRRSVDRFIASGNTFARKKENELEKALLSYAAVNPLSSLEKGFFAVSKEGKRVSSVAELHIGDAVLLTAKDGKALTTIKEIRK